MSEQLDTKALRGRYNAIKRDALSRTDDPWRVNDDPDGFVRVHQGYALTCRLVADTMRQPVAEFLVAMHNAAPLLLDAAEERDALRARVAALQAEVDACGDIIGQPHGATHGHAEILEETIKEHQADNVRLAARVAELESWKSVLLSEYTTRDLQYEAVRDDLRKSSARVAELERDELKWTETCNDLRAQLDASRYAERHDAALKRAHAAEARVAELELENSRLSTPLRPIVDRIHRALGCSELSDDESLPEMVETWVREHREKIAELEREVERVREAHDLDAKALALRERIPAIVEALDAEIANALSTNERLACAQAGGAPFAPEYFDGLAKAIDIVKEAARG